MIKKMSIILLIGMFLICLNGCVEKKIYLKKYVTVSSDCNINQFATLTFNLDVDGIIEFIGKEKIDSALCELNPTQYRQIIDEGKQFDYAALFVLEKDTYRYVSNGDEIVLKIASTPGLDENANIHFLRKLGICFETYTYTVESLDELKTVDMSDFLMDNLYYFGHSPIGNVKIKSEPGAELYKDDCIKILSNEKGYTVYDNNDTPISTSYIEIENLSSNTYMEYSQNNIANGDMIQLHVRKHEVLEMVEYGYLIFAPRALIQVSELSSVIDSIEDVPDNIREILYETEGWIYDFTIGKIYFASELDPGVQEYPYAIVYDVFLHISDETAHSYGKSNCVKLCNPYIDTDGTFQYDVYWYQFGLVPNDKVSDYYISLSQSYKLEEIIS